MRTRQHLDAEGFVRFQPCRLTAAEVPTVKVNSNVPAVFLPKFSLLICLTEFIV
jgi:hypothetical protein